jgi:LysR family nitrogen assimilation transcriptional regulator
MPNDIERPPRSVISLTQIHTFLTLVEEGSVARASRRLGVGHSTVSAHSKLVAEEIGRHQFSRTPGGFTVTAAGLDAYNRFRAFVAHASFCINYFRGNCPAPASFVTIAMPAGFPGSLLDAAVKAVSAKLAATSPEICLLPAYGEVSPTDDLLGLYYGEPEADALTVRDRWILVRSGANIGWSDRPLSLGDLFGLRIQVPKLPPELHGTLMTLAEMAHFTLDWSENGIQGILANASQSQNFCAIVPESLLNGGMAAEYFECIAVERTAFDPSISIFGTAYPGIAADLHAELMAVIRDNAGNPARFMDQSPVLEPDMLSLKRCRSFLALYEEGSVRQAAQRLSIVQPALTVQLHHIEEQVGCMLFTRSHHGLQANERADALYRLLRQLVAEFNTALVHLRAAANKGISPVRIGLIPALDEESLMAEGFAAALDKWSRTYGDGVAQVIEGYSSTLVRWLHSGKIDFALIDRMFADPALIFEPLAEDTMAVVVDSTSGLIRPGPVTVEQLTQLPLVLPSARHGLRTLLAQTLRQRGLSLQPRIEVDSMAGCLSFVKIARYATILPMGSVYKSSDRRRLSVHEIREPRIVRTMCLARSRVKPSSAAERNFLEELRLAFLDGGDRPDPSVGLVVPRPALAAHVL